MPMKPRTHAQRLAAADPPRHGRRVADRDYNAARRAAGTDSAELERLRSTNRWRRLRRLVLSREPLCRPCNALARTELAVAVDHIVPAAVVVASRGDGAFFDDTNLQPICSACHAAKTAAERGVRRVNSECARSQSRAPNVVVADRCHADANGATHSDLSAPTSRGSPDRPNEAGEGSISGGLTHYGGALPSPHSSRVSPGFELPPEPPQRPGPPEVASPPPSVSATPPERLP